MKKICILLIVILFSFNTIFSNNENINEKKERKTYSQAEKYQLQQLLLSVIELVRTQYVTEEDFEYEELIYGAIKGMLKTLDDPFTRFMEPKTYQDMKVDTKGEFGGLGIVISVKEDVLTIISPIEDTPAYDAGIEPGDQIIKIDNEDALGIDIEEAVNKLRGPKGTKVTITIRRTLDVRNDEGKLEKKVLIQDYTLTRDIIKITSVKHKVIADNIGLIRITNFTSTVTDDLEKALLELEKEKVKAFILDLRNNPGGLLNTAVDVASKFLGKADVVTVKNRNGEIKTYSSYVKQHPSLPMIVLVNEGSASASEIVAGALQDNKRAIIVGKKTFGKGCVQTVIPLQGGKSAIALTTAWYYTPSGVCIHDRGIHPDIVVELPKVTAKEAEELIKKYQKEREEEYKKSSKSFKEGQKTDEVSIKEDAKKEKNEDDNLNSLKKKKRIIKNLDGSEPPKEKDLKKYDLDEFDTQLIRAVDVLKALVLYNDFK